jgi:co-chaperonin GroES (HSP10)
MPVLRCWKCLGPVSQEYCESCGAQNKAMKTELDKIRQRETPVLLPMNGRIVVEAISEEKTPSGLYLPSGATEQRATIGKVIALPFDLDNEGYEAGNHIAIGLGDVVLFSQNAGMLIDLGHGAARRKAIILRETEVLCKVTNPDGSPYV